MPDIARSEPEMVQSYRALHPKSRVTSMFKYYLNGNQGPRQMQCIVCSQTGPSWCGKWPKTKTANDWQDDHYQSHLDNPPAHLKVVRTVNL
jgi:hypothetical protein